MSKIKQDIRLLKTVNEKYAPGGAEGKMWKTGGGYFFRPFDASEEFDAEYPDGICINDYQWEMINE